MIRILQTLKGKLLSLSEQPGRPAPFALTIEELMIIRRMLDELVQYPTRFPAFQDQEKEINLSALKKQIEQIYGR